MSIRCAMLRRASARALFIATSLTATPATACELMPAQTLSERLADAQRFTFGPGRLLPFLALWYQHQPADLPDVPDTAAVYAGRGEMLVITFERDGCVLAALPVPEAELWRALREHVGPIA